MTHKFSSENEDIIQFIKKVQQHGIDNNINIQKYFALRFYEFLKKLLELKSMPVDEISLYVFEKFLS